MNKLYLVELIEYYYNGHSECLEQEQAETLGLYTTVEEYKDRVDKEISNYREVSKTAIEIFRDDELEEDCMEAIDIVSKASRVTILVTAITTGSTKKLVDYNRINYLMDYEKTTDIEVINIK